MDFFSLWELEGSLSRADFTENHRGNQKPLQNLSCSECVRRDREERGETCGVMGGVEGVGWRFRQRRGHMVNKMSNS